MKSSSTFCAILLTALLLAGCGKGPQVAALGNNDVVLEEVQPKLPILCHGGNDFLRKQSDVVAAANVRAMIKLARGKSIGVVLIATPKPGLMLSPPDFYAEIAREFAIPFNDDALKSILRDNALKSDLVHPNARGYAQIAQRVAALLKKAGAIRPIAGAKRTGSRSRTATPASRLRPSGSCRRPCRGCRI